MYAHTVLKTDYPQAGSIYFYMQTINTWKAYTYVLSKCLYSFLAG